MHEPTFDATVWLDTTARSLGIDIAEAHRPGVIANLEIAAQMSARLFAVSLDDDIDLAPVFEPASPADSD